MGKQKSHVGLEVGAFRCIGKSKAKGPHRWVFKCMKCGFEKLVRSVYRLRTEKSYSNECQRCKDRERPVKIVKSGVVRPRQARKLVDLEGPAVYPEGVVRPKTRGDCVNGPRPCLWVSCKYNLYLDITKAGSIQFTNPGIEPDQMKESCVLDLTDKGPQTLITIEQVMNTTRQRVLQIETAAVQKLRVAATRNGPGGSLKEYMPDGFDFNKTPPEVVYEDDEEDTAA